MIISPYADTKSNFYKCFVVENHGSESYNNKLT